jgi:hypothetical protein
MSKYTKSQSVISRYSDAYIDEDNWLYKFEKSLQKDAVQSREVDKSMFDQINSIMNNKSKHPSVQSAVDDMKNRSGLTAYLDTLNKKSISDNIVKKIASNENLVPIIFNKHPKIKDTITNYIRDTRGNLPVPAILDKIRSIHQKDVSDSDDWEDDNLIRYISKLNLTEKSKNLSQNNDYSNLGIADVGDDSDIDPSNTDAFYALNPAKI